MKDIIKEYQCPGCVGTNYDTCFEKGYELECGKHEAGTIMGGIGRIFLGLPKGFNRVGYCNRIELLMYKNPIKYDKFNVPAWKYLDPHGNTIVRGLCPRITKPWIHIIVGNHIRKINCIEITKADIDKMD